MSLGDHTLPSVSAITAPDEGFNGTDFTGSGNTDVPFAPWGNPVTLKPFVGGRVLIACDGVTYPKIIAARNGLPLPMRMGILPPVPDDMTATPSGNRATGVFTLSGQPNDGDSISIGPNSTLQITFKTTLQTWNGTYPLPAGYPGSQVLIGASVAETIQNLEALMNFEAGQDSIYHNFFIAGGFPVPDLRDAFDMEISATTATTATFRAVSYGSAANAYFTTVVVNVSGNLAFAAGTLLGGTDGSGDAPLEGSYSYVYRYFRLHDGAFSGAGNIISTQLGVAMNVNLASMADSDDGQVSHIQWFRSLLKGGLFYLGGAIETGGAGTDTDDLLDEEISGGGAVPYNDGEFRRYEAGHVPAYRYMEIHNGSVFGGGAIPMDPYTEGTMSVTENSRAVNPIGTCVFTKDMEGGWLRFDSQGVEYLVVEVTEGSAGTGSLTLATPYEETTNANISFEWREGRDPDELAWSEPNKPNQWPTKNSTLAVVSEDGNGIMGLKSHWESLNVFTRESIYRLSGTPESTYVIRKVVEGVGTVSGHSIIEAEGDLFFVAPGAIMHWGGGPKPNNLTKPIVQQPGDAPGIHETMKRVNWEVGHLISGRFCPITRKLTWLVPLDEDVRPHHRIVFDLQTGGWALDDAHAGFEANWLDRNGVNRVFLGLLNGTIGQGDLGEADGVYGIAPVQTIDSIESTYNRTVTVSGTPFTGLTLDGGMVLLKDSNGDYEAALIAGNTNSAISFTRRLEGTYANGDQMVLGGILMHLKTGEFSNGSAARVGRVADVDVAYVPQTPASRLWMAIGSDVRTLEQPEFGESYADMTDTDGHHRYRANTKGRWHQIELVNPTPGGEPEIIEIGVSYRTAQQARGRV